MILSELASGIVCETNSNYLIRSLDFQTRLPASDIWELCQMTLHHLEAGSKTFAKCQPSVYLYVVAFVLRFSSVLGFTYGLVFMLLSSCVPYVLWFFWFRYVFSSLFFLFILDSTQEPDQLIMALFSSLSNHEIVICLLANKPIFAVAGYC